MYCTAPTWRWYPMFDSVMCVLFPLTRLIWCLSFAFFSLIGCFVEKWHWINKSCKVTNFFHSSCLTFWLTPIETRNSSRKKNVAKAVTKTARFSFSAHIQTHAFQWGPLFVVSFWCLRISIMITYMLYFVWPFFFHIPILDRDQNVIQTVYARSEKCSKAESDFHSPTHTYVFPTTFPSKHKSMHDDNEHKEDKPNQYCCPVQPPSTHTTIKMVFMLTLCTQSDEKREKTR